MSRVLVIDDNQGICDALEVLFSLHDIETVSASSPQEGLSYLEEHLVDLVIQDMNFTEDTTSGEEGQTLFRKINQGYPDLPIILLTAWAHLEMAVDLVKEGASDYLSKPWDDDKLVTTVNNLLELSELRRAQQALISDRNKQFDDLASSFDLCGTVYRSATTHQVLQMAVQVAPADIPVLITGPNGSGKEKIAEVIQANSSLSERPFVKVNVGALPIDLLEAELFGAEVGAFTGASKRRIGRFEAADGGTLFLDEIGNLPLSGQVKLLRVLQTGEFERLGSSETHKVNVRVISATNADLKSMIKTGDFREDLYYRLNVIEVKLPSLADRIDDVLPLAIHFLQAGYQLSLSAEQSLLNYNWPGNVRELENVIRRASLLSQNKKIEATHLGLPENKEVKQSRIEVNKEAIIDALDMCRNNISQAAKQLGLSRQALYRRMTKYGIDKGIS